MNEFFASVYELLFYRQELSSGLYENYDYLIIGLTTALFSAIVPILYYYVINHPRFNQLVHWALVLGLAGLIVFVITWNYVSGTVAILQLDNVRTADIIFFALENSLIFLVLSFLISILLKHWSINCSKTPF